LNEENLHKRDTREMLIASDARVKNKGLSSRSIFQEKIKIHETGMMMKMRGYYVNDSAGQAVGIAFNEELLRWDQGAADLEYPCVERFTLVSRVFDYIRSE
jgi:hypothetical protein